MSKTTYGNYNLQGLAGTITQYNYDLHGQLAITIYALGTPQLTVTSTTYDAKANVLTSADYRSSIWNLRKSVH